MPYVRSTIIKNWLTERWGDRKMREQGMTRVNHAHRWFVTGGVICFLCVGTVQAAAGSESPLRSMKYTSAQRPTRWSGSKMCGPDSGLC